MPKIWQNMKKILVQLALCPFFGWFRIIPKNFEFEYPIHHLFRLLEINFWKLVVQNSNKFWKLKFPKWRSIYYNTVFYNIVHIFFKNLSELFYNTKKKIIFFFFLWREIEPRKNLLNQFRVWKMLKRRHWNIVVTERAKKEMADREQDFRR